MRFALYVLKKQLVHSNSQEEAALVLQKHYRGYQVRNKNNSSLNDNLDANSRKLIKNFCNKWKGRSIYQVILLDRANKLQDVVYFSLQVHMYNQHVIYNLNNMNHRPVMLENVMTTTGVNEFLGSKKCYLYKIPFQLHHMDMMTIDQKHLIDNNMTNYDDIDDGNWDSALNRFPEARTAFKILKHKFEVRDQGVQVGINVNEEGARFTDTNNYNHSQNISTRDRLPKQDHKHHHNNNIDLREKDEQTKMIRPATDNRFYSAKQDKISKTTTAVPDIQKTTKPHDRSNPILELQSKGKQCQSTYANEDDPPYNFQAILKKTNYKRPSFDEWTMKYPAETSGDGKREIMYSKNDRIDQQPIVADKYMNRSKEYKNELNEQLSKATRTELLPGVILEGSSYDL